jgi:cysteinyl-tRNA synthetase
MLRVYNTMSRKKEEFTTIQKGYVGMYCCGPTVYDYPHLGNFRSFVMFDNIRRYLEYAGYEVNQVMNVTDIDDNTISASEKLGVPLGEYTRKYEDAFLQGLKKLNVLPARHYPRATENVDAMLPIVEDLEAKGLAYERGGSIYFNVAKFKGYGKLSGLDMDRIKIGARVDADKYDKENPRDFALLKKSTESEVERGIYFESKWGKVRPGWHIECSALSMKYVGPSLDIHTGGIDLIFPHHENEIAQSESYTGKMFARYWVHGEFLIVDGEKMSKSLGNCVMLEDVLREYSPQVVRYMFVSTHYRKQLDYTREFAENAKSNYEKLQHAYQNLLFALETSDDRESPEDQLFMGEIEDGESRFKAAMDDDFNNPVAVGVLHEMAKTLNRYLLTGRNRVTLEKARGIFDPIFRVLGLGFPAPPSLSPDQAEMVRNREAARAGKDWARSDEIRSQLKEQRIVLEDTDWGTKWRSEQSPGQCSEKP